MYGGNEQRVAIKFCFKAGLSTTETLVMMQKTYGNKALNRSYVCRWYSRFWDGRELVEDERGGRPKSTRTEVNIAAVAADLVKNDHRIASRMTAESLNIPKRRSSDSERGFGKKKVVCTFCSTLLDTWAKGRSSHILPRHYRDGRCQQKFNKIITGDETWCFAYDPETKRQSSEWVGKTSPRLKKLKFQRPHIKTMLIIFLLSRHSAQRICTRWKNSKCRIL
jgi:hypothetical protein